MSAFKSAAISKDKLWELHQARLDTNANPTKAQIEASNYKKGRVTFRGLTVAIENPVGNIRSGRDIDGKEWSRPMHADYGYFVGTRSVDGDAVDVFIGPDPEEGEIWVVDQVKKDGKTFDEPKVILGVDGEEAARTLYLNNYEPGWKGLGALTRMSEAQLKTWLEDKPTGPASKKFAKSKEAGDSVFSLLDNFYSSFMSKKPSKAIDPKTYSAQPQPAAAPQPIVTPKPDLLRSSGLSGTAPVPGHQSRPQVSPMAVADLVKASMLKAAYQRKHVVSKGQNGNWIVDKHPDYNPSWWEEQGGLVGVAQKGIGTAFGEGWKFTGPGMIFDAAGGLLEQGAKAWADRDYWSQRILHGNNDPSLRRSQDFINPQPLTTADYDKVYGKNVVSQMPALREGATSVGNSMQRYGNAFRYTFGKPAAKYHYGPAKQASIGSFLRSMYTPTPVDLQAAGLPGSNWARLGGAKGLAREAGSFLNDTSELAGEIVGGASALPVAAGQLVYSLGRKGLSGGKWTPSGGVGRGRLYDMLFQHVAGKEAPTAQELEGGLSLDSGVGVVDSLFNNRFLARNRWLTNNPLSQFLSGLVTPIVGAVHDFKANL